jgi:TolB-like protein/DNA-binding SARP family transcriptional activator
MLRLRVLGGFALEGPYGALAYPLSKRRAEAVLAVLAISGDLGCSRERLMALLWPESSESQASHGLRDALHAIRRTLGPAAVPAGGRLLRLDSSVITSDAQSYIQALNAGRLADAVRMYPGPLLLGFHVDDAPEFERWVDGERARLAREYVEALKQLAGAAEQAGAWDEAAGWWARAVEHDPLNSHLVSQQARALAAMGDRANAVKVAETHARRLRAELELDPDAEFLSRIEQIRRGDYPLPAETRPPVAPRPVEPAPTEPESHDPARSITRSGPGSDLKRRVFRWGRWAAGVAVMVLLARTVAGRPPRTGERVAGRSRTEVAVLPFRNLSTDTAYAFFAGGLHDELLSQLSRVASLKVVGRTSTRGYEGTTKSLRQIGEELEVGSVVEASVQVVGRRLRVVVQLVDAATQVPLWTERYDRMLDDAFAVQSDIARHIVAAVGATLTKDEAGAIAAIPTRNAEAYAFYLQGLEYARRPGARRENLLIAGELYQRALALDADFALAHAALSQVHVGMYGLRYDQVPARLVQAQREADAALRLAPGLPEAHLAAGMRHRFLGSYREALEEFRRALRGAPNDARMWAWIGRVQRNLGNWDSSIAAFGHARTLDPRDTDLLHSLGDTYHYLRRYGEAIQSYRQALVLAPDRVQTRLSLAWSYILWKGELDTLRTVLQGLPLQGDPGSGGEPVGNQRLILLLWERRPDSLLSLLRVLHPEASLGRAYWELQALGLRGDTAGVRDRFESALAMLERQQTGRDDPDWHFQRGLVLAALGRRAEALREVSWLERADAALQDRYSSGFGASRARILTRIGETDSALVLIERMLDRPSLFSVHQLRLAPDFDPIRSHPRYHALLQKYAPAGTLP